MWDLAEIFQNDSDIHVDDDEKCNDEVGDKIQYRHPGIAAVAVGFNIGCRIVASRGIYHHTIQNSVPTSWRRYLPTQWYMTQQLESNGSLLRQCNSDSLDYNVWEATLEQCISPEAGDRRRDQKSSATDMGSTTNSIKSHAELPRKTFGLTWMQVDYSVHNFWSMGIFEPSGTNLSI